ncbi:MAG: IclR family transcriptional regulator [Hydrogenophaga sp.]|uniref:IclR family transcriptional regulator n=1 Tax=Hydrogenophaga sp. TaxID=1904254 RepID=UPI0025C564E4|nr:IclR family transcriptional regulator [Hydrogenophaga sp.]MBU7575187.1 IclR family transcriptional regulator [Hydrogenophaga sp.]
MTENKDGVAAVERALTIMNAFRIEDQALTLHELAARTGFYKSTILRLLASLIRFGCVQQLPDASYKLGYAVMKWGSVYRQSLRMEDHVAPVLNRLVDLTGEGASYFRREGDVRLCLFRVDPRHSVRDHIYAGQVLPLGQGAAGRALVEFDGPPASWPATRVIFTVGEREPDIAALAAPVFGPGDQVVGSVAISGPSHRFAEAVLPSHTAAVREAAIKLTQHAGGDADWLLGVRKV